MKKTYVSPELELIRFAPAERLADGTIDDLFPPDGENAVSNPNYDFGMPLD